MNRAKTDIDEGTNLPSTSAQNKLPPAGKQKEIRITDPKVPFATLDDPRPVSMKGLFSVSTTSMKAPYLIKDEIERVLGNHKIRFSAAGYDLVCSYTPQITSSENAPKTDVQFEISVVKLQLIGMHGVMVKKLSGDAWTYKTICQRILQDLKL